MELDFEAISAPERYKFITHVVVPRPIAWVTTINEAGQVNAAPFSFFNVFGSRPAMVALGIANRPSGEIKDTVRNIRSGGEFVINMVTEELAEQMVKTAAELPHGESELAMVGLTTCPSIKVKPPRIAESPVHLECRELSTQLIEGNRLVLGKIVHAAVKDRFYDSAANRVLTEKMRPVGRMHGPDGYVTTRDYFEIERPAGVP